MKKVTEPLINVQRRLSSYSGELGASYTSDKTIFRLWSPAAAKARVNLYPSGDGSPATLSLEMTQTGGVWMAEYASDLKNVYYTYTVEINGCENEAVDPYAKAAGVNGKRGMVVDLAATNPSGWENDAPPPLVRPTDAVVYELSIRDFSVAESSGMVNKGKYLAFTEENTKNADGLKTGVAHITELGVTHVQLMPCFDFFSIDESNQGQAEYNWGYDPQNYNLPEGSYSANPFDGEVRITELKRMVQSLHKNGLRVIMDVVYNHTALTEDSDLNKLAPGYYYRQDASGRFYDGSGCHNETASERAMVRRLIIDSVVYWAKEYHIDGFRFDLMALHDIDTMNAVREALDKVDESILIYGEGWTGGITPLPRKKQALKVNAGLLNGRIGMFSDDMRDGIKGSVSKAKQPGYVGGNYKRKEDVRFGVAASCKHPQIDYLKLSYSSAPWAKAPSQTINYASAHDDLTLWDKLQAACPKADNEALTAMNKLSALLVLTSQGIPFFQAGEEFARTKYGEKNSYMSPDSVNKLEWSNKAAHSGLFEYYKGLISLRRAHPAFRLGTAEEIAEHLEFLETESQVMAYVLKNHAGGDKVETFLVAVNAGARKRSLKLPKAGWHILVDGEAAGLLSIGRIEGDLLTLSPKTGYILASNL